MSKGVRPRTTLSDHVVCCWLCCFVLSSQRFRVAGAIRSQGSLPPPAPHSCQHGFSEGRLIDLSIRRPPSDESTVHSSLPVICVEPGLRPWRPRPHHDPDAPAFAARIDGCGRHCVPMNSSHPMCAVCVFVSVCLWEPTFACSACRQVFGARLSTQPWAPVHPLGRVWRSAGSHPL